METMFQMEKIKKGAVPLHRGSPPSPLWWILDVEQDRFNGFLE